MVSRKVRKQRFPGTERRLGIPPNRNFMLGDTIDFDMIEFPGTQRRLGTPPRRIDQRKKAQRFLFKFNLDEELI